MALVQMFQGNLLWDISANETVTSSVDMTLILGLFLLIHDYKLVLYTMLLSSYLTDQAINLEKSSNLCMLLLLHLSPGKYWLDYNNSS